MDNEIKVFENDGFGTIRTIEENGKILFCGTDVAKALGYSDTAKAIKAHCKEDGWAICPVIDNMGREQQAKFINEGNVYRLITHSKLPSAEKFEHWVFDEVLPTIRKTGGYVANSELMVTTYFGNLSADQQTLVKGLFDNILAQQEIINAQNKEICTKNEKIDNLSITNEALIAEVLTWADANLINALVRRYANRACAGSFVDAWVTYKKELLYKYGINLNARKTAYINRTCKKPKIAQLLENQEELTSALRTIISMCEEEKIDISDLLKKQKAA